MNGRKSGHVKRSGCDLHALIDGKGESGPMDVERHLGRINLIPGINMNRTRRRRLTHRRRTDRLYSNNSMYIYVRYKKGGKREPVVQDVNLVKKRCIYRKPVRNNTQ